MPRIDPAAPPTRDSVLDSDGNPIIGSDMPKYFIWLDVVEKKLKTANPDFFELYTTGVHTTSKHTVVTNAEHATELYDNADRPKYTFAVPSPLKAQSSAIMSEEITKSGRFSVNPDLISKIDRSGANKIDAWLENSTMRDALSAASEVVERFEGLYQWTVEITDGACMNGRSLAAGLHRPKSGSHLYSLAADAAAAIMHHRLHCSAETLRKLPSITADAPKNLHHSPLVVAPPRSAEFKFQAGRTT